MTRLTEDNLSMDDVAMVAEGGEILLTVNKVRSPTWPQVFHTQSFMGCEAPVVIWVSSGVYFDRQVCMYTGYSL